MMPALRERSLQLTSALESFLVKSKYFVPVDRVSNSTDFAKPGFTIITPTQPSARGAQLSLLFLPIGSGVMRNIFDALVKEGVIGDEREPDVIRLAPTPLYNTLKDCEHAAESLERAFSTL